MKKPTSRPGLIVSLCLCTLAAAMPLKLERFDGPAATFQEPPGTVEIRGPMSVRVTPSSRPGAEDRVLEFEYFCAGGVPSFAALPGPPFEAKTSRMLPGLGHSEAWKSYTARLSTPDKPLPDGWKELRLDLPLPAERVLQIRNARLRPEVAGEFDATKATTSTASTEEALRTYLDQTPSANITKVSVGKDAVRIEGRSANPGSNLYLADIPMDVLLDDPQGWRTLVEITTNADGSFQTEIPRHRQRDGRDYDRLTSRWQLVRKTGDAVEPLSKARYAEEVASRSPGLPPARPANKKGLGGWHIGHLPDELDELGITAVTVNVMIHSLISLTPGPDTTPVRWQGRTYHANEKALAAMDATFIEAQKHHVMVSAILLIPNPAKDGSPVVKVMGHPDANREGIFSMPNVTSDDGISLYGAVLNLMAERWSRPDGRYGRVHHWIMHNEVDAGWVWTNAGEKTAITYLDLYQRSMRLMDLIARQYDPNSRAFISLTHFWAGAGDKRWYGSKRLIDLLVEFTRAEGDFPWALAYHPYPQDLFNPRTWEDKEATFAFDSHLITPKNLEVLDAYMKQPALLHQGKVRPVHLSENGFNSKDYSPKELEDQAAGMALAWKKMAGLSSIESWQYHNWVDNRGEGGLKIGLRKFPDEPGDPLGRKPIWHLYQALGTPKEDELASPYLKTIGIKSWDEVIYRKPVR
ncbi:hypothetical protein JIN84_08245 [Luteolibacter yonseiensis]|uniref:DUF5722 domain-containing protein n=1 Tax=Luteolibacter yonseiensis TaxID=1144680 RepID=A0A934V700_9BACT|nr:DUF5722 domain-containing protein [Luteolibacter yonseiensis]MBK1815602.1 hypothetical protein [Luteolibacter yonseiensis]